MENGADLQVITSPGYGKGTSNGVGNGNVNNNGNGFGVGTGNGVGIGLQNLKVRPTRPCKTFPDTRVMKHHFLRLA
jgi:hypothetical protein